MLGHLKGKRSVLLKKQNVTQSVDLVYFIFIFCVSLSRHVCIQIQMHREDKKIHKNKTKNIFSARSLLACTEVYLLYYVP
jgi:hypothetical protein